MIVKIIPLKSNNVRHAISYNTGKNDRNDGELMKVANFGPLQAFTRIRPQDYTNYLQMVNALNRNIKRPQFHAIISSRQKEYDKSELTSAGEAWMKEMGFGRQPYMIVFHKDTIHNHLHIVSTRVTKQGRRIEHASDYFMAQRCMEKVLGYEFALQYRFSSRDQFLPLLKNQGYLGRNPNERKIQERISLFVPEPSRLLAIRQMINRHLAQADFEAVLHEKHGIDLALHGSEGNEPDGYSVIDHKEKQVFKGSEVIPLKFLLPALAAGRKKEPAPALEMTGAASIPQLPNKGESGGLQRELAGRARGR